jgi:hypothetical protein
MNKLFKTLCLLSFLALVLTCHKSKRFRFKGTVYSKHHFIMQNTKLNFGYSTNKKQAAGVVSATTNVAGQFYFDNTSRTNTIDQLTINCDSGSYNSATDSPALVQDTDLEIILK